MRIHHRVAFPALLLFVCLPGWVQAQKPVAPIDANGLVGLWGSDRFFGPEVRGLLTVVKRGPDWSASIAGYSVPMEVKAGAASFQLPEGKGGFKGRFKGKSNQLRGHWIQPAQMVSGTAYATPVDLRSKDGRVWRGEVVPLDDRFTVYLFVQRDPDGVVRAFFRNPERNLTRGATFDVSVEGEAIRLARPKSNQKIDGAYDSKAGRLSFRFNQVNDAIFDFTKRDPEQALGFAIRVPMQRYQYRRPVDDDDGWATASLSEVGLDEARISALVQHILDGESRKAGGPRIQGLLIARHGKLVLEEYFDGFSRERPHDLRSAGKTFSTSLVGAAIAHGARLSVKTPVYAAFANYPSFANSDPRKQQVTVEHLLTMSSGLACDDDDESSPGNEDTMQSQTAQPDWHKYALDLPLQHPPGEFAAYCTATINLLGGVLHNVTGSWLPDLLHQYIAEPLDFRRYHVNLMPTGEGYLGGGLYLRPRDFIKLGQLFLQGGVWRGRRVVSKDWAEQATVQHTRLNNGNSDGYNWWLREMRVAEHSYRTYAAGGNGGQTVTVIPELDLVVMFTAGNYGDRIWTKIVPELVPQYILAAASSR